MNKKELLATIQQEKNEQSTELDLFWEGITELPPEIGQLTALKLLGSKSTHTIAA
ncbi:MAG: hypothetical protein QX189_08160 [Methylococcales bacterium]